MMSVVSDRHREICWICHGSGRANLLADTSARICAMCSGTGLVGSVPTTTSEMVTAMLAVPGIPRIELTDDDHKRIDEIEEIVRACVAEILAEESGLKGR